MGSHFIVPWVLGYNNMDRPTVIWTHGSDWATCILVCKTENKKQKTFQNIPQIPDICRLCLHEMENSVQHDKKYKTFKKQKTFQNIPQIPDIYRFCLHEMENSVQHDKKYKTFKKQKNIPEYSANSRYIQVMPL